MATSRSVKCPFLSDSERDSRGISLGQGWKFGLKRDYLVAQVLALLLTFTVISVNTLADIAYAYVDPKIRAHAAAA